jgi:hypothetical protein
MYQLEERSSYYALYVAIIKGECADKAVRHFMFTDSAPALGYIARGKVHWSIASQAIARTFRSNGRSKMNEV